MAVPTVTTTAITAITDVAATGGGNVTSDGGAAVTARGVCWAVTTTPTVASSKTTQTGTTGAYVSSLTGLNAGTIYHVRAYATNADGTGYGAEVDFTTLTATNPLFDGTLTVSVARAPAPRTYHDVTAALLPGLSYSSTNPGGFGECSFQIEAASPWAAYVTAGHTVAKGDLVSVLHGAVVLFEGAITNDVSHATVEGGAAYYDVTCAGLWWKAGQRGDFCRTWGDDDPGQWFELKSGGVFEVDTEGKVDIRLEAGQAAKNGASKSLYYWLDGGMGDPADGITYVLGTVEGNVSDKDSALWHADIYTSDSPWGTWTSEVSWDNETITAGTVLVGQISGSPRALRLALYVSGATSTGTTADRYIQLSNFSVITSSVSYKTITDIGVANPTVLTSAAHGFQTDDRVFIWGSTSTPNIDGWRTVTRTGDNTVTIPVNVTIGESAPCFAMYPNRVDGAMADIAETTGLATATDLSATGIGNLNWGLNVRPHMSRADAIEMLAAANPDPIDYGFWDSETFYCKERIAAAGTHDILVDSSVPGIDFDVFADTEESPTHVKLLYLFRDVDGGTSVYPDGTVLAVYRPSAPTWADAAVVLDVWDQWADLSLETGQAEAIGDQILAWIASNKYAGTITIATPTVPVRGGGTRTTAYLRAGDYIEDSNLATGTLQISSVSVDVDSGVVTLGIGESRAEFVARITKRQRWDQPSQRPYHPPGPSRKRR